MKTLASELFTQEAVSAIAAEIEANEGQEVSFVGFVDSNGVVCEVKPMAYGNSESTPVQLMDALKGDVLIHNHPPSGGKDAEADLRASPEDITLATELANRRIGFYIIDNACVQANVIFRPEARVALKPEEVLSVFQEGGSLSRVISRFEPRPEQVELVSGVIDAVNGSKILVSEAGTGTGKSLAYLVPGAVWAVKNKKRVVVSTHTINLQQQIEGKDMPIVERVLKELTGEEAAYSVLIGKGNYLCRKKLNELLRDGERRESLFEGEQDRDLLERISDWSGRCHEGTVGEYGDRLPDGFWEELCCDTQSCTRRKCPYYGDCFYYRARLEAERSNILIVNHSLVFSTIDEKSRKSTLPFFSGIVFDEAHHLEDVALRSLSQEFSVQGLLYQFRKILSRKKDREFGLLPLLDRKAGLKTHPELAERYEAICQAVRSSVRELADLLFAVAELLRDRLKESSSVGLDDAFAGTPEFSRLTGLLDAVFRSVGQFTAGYELLAERVRATATNREAADVLNSISFRVQSLTEARLVYDRIFKTDTDPEFVRWLEVTKKNVRFYCSPLEVGDFLAGSLFTRKDFTVFTSATLQINKKFDYFSASTGLSISTTKEKIEIALASPFDYRRQAEVFVLEEPVNHGSVSREKTELIRELCLMSEGGALVLFTSYARLTEMFGILKDEFAAAGLLPLRQGEAGRDELLRQMAKNPNVVLFATSSFWEGIDIQGDNLRCVVIEKLPFDSPADPVYKAKVDMLRERGMNPFAAYSIPRAVLRLKQGMGRLIRSKTDKGVIAILDDRLLTKKYGPVFLNSIPPARVVTGGVQHILREAESFMVRSFAKTGQ